MVDKYRVNDFVKFNYSDIGEYVDEYHTDTPLRNDEVMDKLNELTTKCSQLEKENEQLKHRLSKFQSKYDKSKTDEIEILVETENTILLNKEEFQQYVRRHNELKRHNKRRKQKLKRFK